ncbi:MAG: right-handed parallel beta-helix repeat-containing protein [Methanomicrobiales archaeon]|nr:right-handed parallel beta-helix repeat-containing protein [Methanomicrobiales archaeon]
MKSLLSLAIVFVLIVACFFAGCAQLGTAPTNQNTGQSATPVLVSGPLKISHPGLYQLTNDLIPSSLDKTSPTSMTYVCINIRSPNVIFDGMGHVIDGNRIQPKCTWSNSYKICDASYGIYAGVSRDKQYQLYNIEIRNVTLSNWTTGMYFSGTKNAILENSLITRNENSIHIFYTSNITIRKNALLNNKNSGIEGRDNEKLTISENAILHNRNTGIVLNGLTESPVMINVPGPLQSIFGNWIFLSPFTTISERLTSGGGHTISQNEIRDNRGGIMLENSEGNTIEQNILRDNQGDGLWLDKVDLTTVKDNTIVNSSTRGIFQKNCGLNLVLANNTISGNYENVQIYTYPESVPLTIIIGTLLVFLLKVFAGTFNVVQKFGSSRAAKAIKTKFQPFDEAIRSRTHTSRISVLFEGATPVSILGAIIFGGAFTYSTTYGLKGEVLLTLILIGGIVIIIPKVVQYLVAQRLGVQAEYRMWWGGILVMILTTVLFRYVFGQPVRADIVHEESVGKQQLAIVRLSGPVVSIVLSSVFFVLYLLKGTFASLAMLGTEMSLLTALVTLLPLYPMDGEQVYTWKKLVWAGVFIPILLGYVYLLFRI